MADDPSLLAQIGIRVPALFAGLAGGIVGAWADNKAGVMTWAGAIICGGLTANWLAEPASHILGTNWANEGTAGFFVGGSAYGIVVGIKKAAASWVPTIGGGK